MTLARRIAPLMSRLRPRFGRSNSYKAGAAHSWILAPEERAQVPTAIFEAEDLAKIQAVAPDASSLAGELERVRGGPVTHFATTAYELRDAVLSGGQLFTREVYYRLGDERARLFASGALREHADAVLASSHYGVKYFGHWMNDDLPKLLAARDIGHAVSTLLRPTAAQRRYLELLGLETETLSDAWFRKIVVIDDVGQNAYKRERIRRLRALAGAHAPAEPSAGVMLLRGHTGIRRVLLNEDDVAEMARRRGYAVIDPAAVDAGELLRICVGARVVVGVEGSQLMNGIMWMAADGAVLTIQPPQRFTMVLKAYCDAVGIRFAFIVGDARGSDDFRVDPQALERMLDRVEKGPSSV